VPQQAQLEGHARDVKQNIATIRTIEWRIGGVNTSRQLDEVLMNFRFDEGHVDYLLDLDLVMAFMRMA
jgi:hypothetical protein